MEFRIGINLGDVIEEEERIYGDGVNIAARVEELSTAGGISISGTVYEHIKDKLSLGYHYLDEQKVKNIPEPVRVYRLITGPEDAGTMIAAQKPKAGNWRWAGLGVIAIIILVAGIHTTWNYGQRPAVELTSVESMALPLPDKPSIAAQKKAIALSPNDADGIAGLGGILTWAGRPEEAIGLVKKAMRLNPMYPLEYLWNLGHAYYLTRRYEEAIETFKRAIDRSPDWMPVHAYLAATYSELERMEEAHAEAAESNRLSPRTCIEEFKHRVPYKDQAVTERLYNSCRKAGMK
jgi:tetratricopeptide (TPR) repeat protein